MLKNTTLTSVIRGFTDSGKGKNLGETVNKGKGIEYFKHGRLFKSQSVFVTTFQTRNEKPTETSYSLNYCVAVAAEGHMITERLIKPVHCSRNACWMKNQSKKKKNGHAIFQRCSSSPN